MNNIVIPKGTDAVTMLWNKTPHTLTFYKVHGNHTFKTSKDIYAKDVVSFETDRDLISTLLYDAVIAELKKDFGPPAEIWKYYNIHVFVGWMPTNGMQEFRDRCWVLITAKASA